MPQNTRPHRDGTPANCEAWRTPPSANDLSRGPPPSATSMGKRPTFCFESQRKGGTHPSLGAATEGPHACNAGASHWPCCRRACANRRAAPLRRAIALSVQDAPQIPLYRILCSRDPTLLSSRQVVDTFCLLSKVLETGRLFYTFSQRFSYSVDRLVDSLSRRQTLNLWQKSIFSCLSM